MFGVFLLFLMAMSCNGVPKYKCYAYFFPLRTPLYYHNAPEGKTWMEWDETCSREHRGYGLLQWEYEQANASNAGDCADLIIPLRLQLINGTLFWTGSFGVLDLVKLRSTYDSLDLRYDHGIQTLLIKLY